MKHLALGSLVVTLAACGGPAAPDGGGAGAPDAATLERRDGGDASDAGVGDSGTTDAGPADAGAPDAGTTDAGTCPSSCDDGNPCTDDSCGDAGCVHAPLNGTACDDGNLCTTGDMCRAGTCSGDAVVCAAPGRCELQGSCQPSTGQCSRPFAPTGTSCDDANASTFEDTCDALGACAGRMVLCPLDTTCLTWTPNGSQTCTSTAHANRTCDDASASTHSDTCSAAGACVGTAVVCPASTTCLTWTPNGTSTCTATPRPTLACDDANLATSGDTCDAAGACVGTPVVCPANTACRTYAANGTATCTMTPRSGACDDGNLATSGDTCNTAGTCVGTPVVCPANTACTRYTANGTATCTATSLDGNACEDQDACTPTGTCSAGACLVPAPVTCGNGGTCANGGCACTAGWTGPTCARDVDECALNRCGGGSTCTNTQGSFSCQCLQNYASATGANCNSTTSAMEVVVFYDESVARRYGPEVEARIASIFARSKALYDGSLRPPQLTLSLNAVVRLDPLPSSFVMRACNTTNPENTACVGCFQGGTSGGACGSLVSSSASEIDTEQLLSSFTTWVSGRRAAINTMAGGFDVAVLLTEADFASSTMGLAWVGGTCTTTYSAAVVSISGNATDVNVGTIIAHELGHTLNMQHDVASGFVMAPSTGTGTTPTSFSSQSITQYQNWLNNPPKTCLADVAQHDWALRTCGNGVVDEGETCDPAFTTDTCCSSTCQLNPGCACANTERCCVNGTLRPSGTTCRAARSECDLADTCDGVSAGCRDALKSPRAACSNNGLCYGGECASRAIQCSTVAPYPPYDTQLACDSSTRCDALECTLQGQQACGITWTVVPKSGTGCGASSQCLGGLCVPSASLKTYAWSTSAWSSCTGGTSTRTVTCIDEAGTVAASSNCDPDTRPTSSRTCTP